MKGKWWARGAALALTVLFVAGGMTFFLQTGWSHREPRFEPEGPMQDLTAVLEKKERSSADYDLVFQQTGLSPAGVESLLKKGKSGRETILETQKGFFAGYEPTCISLIGGRFTCEDLLRDEEGKPIYAVPIVPLLAGDILLSFSTHSLGWRHGHAGLVVDPHEKKVLEAVQIGVNSYPASLRHWANYSNFLVLRVAGATMQERGEVARFAWKHLRNVPYSLLPGITSPKDGPVETGPGVHCAYLPWYAWAKNGVDLDANGGAIVTVGDLARSSQLEVVQIYGIDPALVEDRLCAA